MQNDNNNKNGENNNQNGNNNNTKEEEFKCRYFLELKVQRPAKTGTELTIRYNSVFDVSNIFVYVHIIFID